MRKIQHGFTLLELMIVTAIVGILASRAHAEVNTDALPATVNRLLQGGHGA